MTDCAGFQTWVLFDSIVEASPTFLLVRTRQSALHRRGRPATWILAINFLSIILGEPVPFAASVSLSEKWDGLGLVLAVRKKRQ